MLDLRPVALINGVLLCILAAGMIIPGAVDAMMGNGDWRVFATSAMVTLFIGLALVFTCRTDIVRLTIRQAFLLTTLIWVILPAFAALPFAFSELDLDYADAFFEAMSGITTTGATVIVGLDVSPPGLLLWRGILQWLGGIGIIIMALTVLPMLRVGGMQMFKVEAFEAQEKVLPRATSLASALVGIYVLLTALWAMMLWMVGMTSLEAVVHAMTTIATGGYSTADASVGYFQSWRIDVIITLGMVVGGIPFLLYFQVARGKPLSIIRDTQVRWYLMTLGLGILSVAAWLWWDGGMHPAQALRYASFNVTSVMTGTGFATADYWQWSGVAVSVMFCLMFVGGCAGSTSCGIKIFRFQILAATARIQLLRLLQPHGVFIPYYNKRPIEDGVAESVMAFFFLYGLCTALLTIALGALGLDFVTALSGAATAISNVGPGLGEIIGPAGNFSSLPDAAKWLLSLGMLLGRLELFTVLVLIMPRFWRG
ncbi:TrkH family potassium uptake protein [Rhodospirillum sp. A1_3_36]|uniref:TrkH family potassium uptake protein n=1 Tax=Rhodospirillum sp. A1_3_36 TaxID=3391666 RepID=UPI0039A5B5CD